MKATEEGKPASVKVSFKVKKTGKASKYSYISKVNVIDEKLTMTAAATKVKQITVTFNKAVDTTTTKLVVKKGSATPTITATTFAADAKSAEITMGTKLTEGTYTVEATVGTDVLTADIAVQDEKLTSFALVSKDLVATYDSTDSQKDATISYKALNQYGEMMPADSVKPTCSFGTVDEGKSTTPTADKAGKVYVKSIPDVLAIPGQTGTLVLVDTTTGVNLNETVTYQTKAVAASATVYGIYNSKTEKLVEGNLKTNEKVTNYSLLVNVQNQYGSDMTPDDIVKSGCEVTYNAASVITNVSVDGKKVAGSETELTYDGKSCFLVKLTADSSTSGTIDKAGTMSLTMVSANKGVIASPSFTIDDAVMIKSLSISAKDTVYADQENELVVEAIDVNGNAVTKYESLDKAIEATANDGDSIVLKKNSDGTGTFYLKVASKAGTSDRKYKDSDLKTLVFKANDPTSGNYIVKTVNMTAYANREAWKVSGVTADTTLATDATASSKVVIKLSTLTYEDQYSNTLKYSDKQVKDNVASKFSAYLVDKDGIFGGDATGAAIGSVGSYGTDSDGNKTIELTAAGSTKGSATLYMKWSNSADATTATALKYDVKVTVSTVDIKGVTADNLKVTVNNGEAIYGVGKAVLTPATENKVAPATKDCLDAINPTVVVTGTIGGKTVVIPTNRWTITGGGSLGDYGKVVAVTNPAKTEKKTVTVVVESEEGPQTITTEVTVSNENPAAKTIKAASTKDISGVTSGAGIVTAAALYDTIEVKDQYGVKMTDKAESIQYTVTFIGDNAKDLQNEDHVKYNATQNVSLTLIGGTYNATVKYVLGDIVFSQDIKITVNNA